MIRRPFRSLVVDSRWAVASGIQMFPVDDLTLDLLAGEAGLAAADQPVEAMIIGRRHPTGWFLHAQRRHSLAGDTLSSLRELVTVRCYLLLTDGPRPEIWQPVSGAEGVWRSAALGVADGFSGLEVA